MSKLVTNKVRFSYANVFEPHDMGGGDLKYSVAVIISKTDTDTYNRIMAEVNRIAQEAVSEVFGGVMPVNLALPVLDGDGLRQSGEPFGPECKGCWVLNAKSGNAPEVVDASCNPIINKNEFYSGCYGRVSLNFYAYNKNGKKGVGCGLGNIQKLEDGQPLDGRTTAAEDFGNPIGVSQPTQPQYQVPMTPTQPVVPQAPMTPVQQPVQPQYQAPVQHAIPQYQAPVAPVQQPVQPMQGQTLNTIYGVN